MTRKSKQPIKTFGIQQTENKNICVDKLPEFSRANKYIGEYNVYVKDNEVPDGTRCTIYAYSVKTGQGELKNNVSVVKDGIAKFDDIRFIGKSGRGTRFDVYFKFDTMPEIIVSYKHAIKVTVDGPRPPRTLKIDTTNQSTLAISPSSQASSLCKRKLDSLDSPDYCVDEFDRCTSVTKMLKLEDTLHKTRRESLSSSSKSPESNSILSSYPSSPQSSFNSSESTCFNFPTDANISAFNNNNKIIPITLANRFNLSNPMLDAHQVYFNDYLYNCTSQLDLNEYSEIFNKYFWQAVQYYMLKHQMNLN